MTEDLAAQQAADIEIVKRIAAIYEAAAEGAEDERS